MKKFRNKQNPTQVFNTANEAMAAGVDFNSIEEFDAPDTPNGGSAYTAPDEGTLNALVSSIDAARKSQRRDGSSSVRGIPVTEGGEYTLTGKHHTEKTDDGTSWEAMETKEGTLVSVAALCRRGNGIVGKEVNADTEGEVIKGILKITDKVKCVAILKSGDRKYPMWELVK